jgi:S-DNA-T family DNA segregation ATPase FtsK/SpoIIIE
MSGNQKNNKKRSAAGAVEPSTAKLPNRGTQIRKSIGLAFLLLGSFTIVSLISYFFTWQNDQNYFFAQTDIIDFVLHPKEAVHNRYGHAGAALGHLLVYRGVGIAALAVGLWLVAIGVLLLSGRKYALILRYLRWLSIFLLVLAPTLAYLLPQATFPFGGAWGNESIAYLNQLIGHAGTGMAIFTVLCFFVFVIFALDITPLWHKAKRLSSAVATTALPHQSGGAVSQDDMPPFAPDPPTEIAPIDSPTGQKEYDLTLSEKTPLTPEQPNKEDLIFQSFKNSNEADFPDEEDPVLAYAAPQEQARHNPLLHKHTEFSFEVITQDEEPAALAHKANISIASNEPYAPELELSDYQFPTLDLLEDRSLENIPLDKDELEKNKTQIIQTLRSFSIEIQRISATVGPTVTLYEIVPAEGVRISKIRNLEDDIALNLAALGIRIIAPIPGRGTIGIEVPNANKQIVAMRTLLSSEKFVNNKMSLPIALGKKIDNENYIVDLATMPHLLMAGATGQGKSVGINAILVSLLYKKHPSQVKFVLVDPKKVELSIYQTIEKHFLAKLPNEEEAIITDTKKVINTLNALCIEMENRYELLKEAGTRNIREYNDKFIARRLNPEKGHKFLPFIVLVVDEFADLIMTAGKEVEIPIARLAQLARAVGIHLIIATQRPSVNVITGTIKANFPARIAFKVSAKVDSRTILDTGGAEQLVGRGDMLVSHGSELLRLQCAFVDTPEVEHVVSFIGKQRGYPSAFELPEYEGADDEGTEKNIDLTKRDKLFAECAFLVVQTQSGSTSNLQRKFNIGYNRAGRIMDQLEAAGIVGPGAGSKPREVLYYSETELEQFLETLL